MSAFLGPIHYWMFNKIQILESRAFAIAASLETGGKAEPVKKAIDGYGERLDGKDIAVLLGDNPIHQFLEGLIGKVEVFEAQLVEAAGDDFDKVLSAVEAHGREMAARALGASGGKMGSLHDIYQVVNEYQLEGMPCDPGAVVEELSDDKMIYAHSSCNHIRNWEYTGVDVKKMCDVNNTWLKGLITGLNGGAEYTVLETIAGGAGSCRAEMKL